VEDIFFEECILVKDKILIEKRLSPIETQLHA